MLKISYISLLSAFDNGTPGWKLDADGHVVLKDGNPVYVKADGTEQTVLQDTIGRLNTEAKNYREAKEAAEAKLKTFDGIDPDAAKKALDTVKNIDAKKLIDSGEVETLKKQLRDEFTTQLAEKEAALSASTNKINDMLITDIFKGSDFVRENLAVPRDMFEATFRNNFKVEDGKVVAYGKDGNKLLSKSHAGEYATPEEALQLLVESHPQKDVIIKANVGSGSGNNGGGGFKGGSRSVKRSEFEKMTPVMQAEISGKVRAGEMSLTD